MYIYWYTIKFFFDTFSQISTCTYFGESMKYLNPFLTKETLLGTTILSISILFIKIGLYVDQSFASGFQYHQIL